MAKEIVCTKAHWWVSVSQWGSGGWLTVVVYSCKSIKEQLEINLEKLVFFPLKCTWLLINWIKQMHFGDFWVGMWN